ncbi:MAG TPA: Trm112 family protein [Burkholderiales bacterium]|nr:Trm112 family protein [Pseudomonadota bacterium]HVC48806.1 Trm112 family protein [Burkholderiales bacterium]
MDPKLIEILVCPVCKGPLDYRRGATEMICKGCRLAYPVHDDIPVLIEQEARELGPEE